MSILRGILLVLAVGAFQATHAHTDLQASVPGDGAALESAPERIELTFSGMVRLTALTVQRDEGDERVLGPLPAATAAEFSVTLPMLESGHYTVSWRALSEDTHVMSGEFAFTIASAAEHEGQRDPAKTVPAEAADNPPATDGTN